MLKVGTIGFERLNLDVFPEDHYFRTLQLWVDKNINEGKFFEYVIVNGFPIHFNPQYKRIGVNFSGGGDSTVLLLILAEIIKQLKFDIKIVPLAVARWYDLVDENCNKMFEEVYLYLLKKYPEIIDPIVWGFLPPPFENTPIKNIVLPNNEIGDAFKWLSENDANADVLYFHYYNDWASIKYNIDAIYNATTVNPVIPNFIYSGRPFRNPQHDLFDHVPFIFKPPHFKNVLMASPFERIEKSWTTAQFFNFDVKELYEMTQSCHIFNGCNDFESCFHCFERDWAYKNKFYYLKENAYEF